MNGFSFTRTKVTWDRQGAMVTFYHRDHDDLHARVYEADLLAAARMMGTFQPDDLLWDILLRYHPEWSACSGERKKSLISFNKGDHYKRLDRVTDHYPPRTPADLIAIYVAIQEAF